MGPLAPAGGRPCATRFDIALLICRLPGVAHWVMQQPAPAALRLGFFRASTGAASALGAAAEAGSRVVAVPVPSSQALGRLQVVADEVVCLLAPPHFHVVGQFYNDFTQVTDEEVVALLHPAEPPPT